jgi:DeoR/GlpR family transcriptional regulator of sugar metabolism
MTQIERLLRLLRRIDQDWQGVTDLAIAFCVCERTIRRDIRLLPKPMALRS